MRATGGLGLQVEAALEALKDALVERIRQEQRVDQLTGLANLIARDEMIRELVTTSSDFTAAFMEVDRFKWINSQFGYDGADALLVEIGKVLTAHAAEVFADYGAAAFRPHGDEFFLVAPRATAQDADDVLERLESLRARVKAITLDFQGKRLSCTVTIGWVVASDLNRAADRSPHGVLDALEVAVAVGKSTRDCVSRYSAELRRKHRESVRTDCTACGSSFSVDATREQLEASNTLQCPTCSSSVARPPLPPAREQSIAPTDI